MNWNKKVHHVVEASILYIFIVFCLNWPPEEFPHRYVCDGYKGKCTHILLFLFLNIIFFFSMSFSPSSQSHLLLLLLINSHITRYTCGTGVWAICAHTHLQLKAVWFVLFVLLLLLLLLLLLFFCSFLPSFLPSFLLSFFPSFFPSFQMMRMMMTGDE